MLIQHPPMIRPIALICLTATLLIGCDSKKSEPVPASPESASAVAVVLAKADAVDGKTDKIITRCAGCALGMDGKQDHELVVGEYRMHFCNAGCKDRFARNPDKEILALKIPD
ncbi:MAG: hypothetical protein KF841_06305 [Phycisphaerae bacterium]|nr:hypothetical protein [Phycisphaerae bacterium]